MNYFYDQFGINKTKFRRVFVGSDDKIFFPRSVSKEDDNFLVVFWGTYIPLQGVEHIVHAAKLLENREDIKFEMIGSGRTFSFVKQLSERLRSNNISFFTKWIPYEKLPIYVAQADVCLGIFGGTQKATRVIPNKAFEALAMEKPLITGDSSAAREALTDMKNCVLCEMANSKAIAESIMLLKDDERLRKKIATNGYNLFKTKFTPRVIGKELKEHLKNCFE
jgi:glycosyltransferase involved in cell wall biosynthesis